MGDTLVLSGRSCPQVGDNMLTLDHTLAAEGGADQNRVEHSFCSRVLCSSLADSCHNRVGAYCWGVLAHYCPAVQYKTH